MKKELNFNVEMTNLISLKDFGSLLGHKGPNVKKLLKFVLGKAFNEQFVTEKGEILSCFYGTNHRLSSESVFIDKRAILYFTKKYAETLIEMGFNSDCIKSIIHQIPRVAPNSDGILNLWGVMSKLSPNSKCVSDLCRYVIDDYLDVEYPAMSESGCFRLEKMFVFAKGKAGRSGFALKKAAYPYFMKRYKEELKQKAKDLNEASTIISIRGLLRELNMMENKDLDLKKFIVDNCLNDTFELKNEEGIIQKLPCFTYTENRYLSIDKRALHTFTTRYENELKKLGFKNFEHALNDMPKLAGRSMLYSLNELQELLKCPLLKTKLTTFLEEKGIDCLKVKTKEGHELPAFKIFYSKGEKRYFMEKDLFVPFLKQYQTLLETFGVRREFILDRSGTKKIPYKDSQMILFDDFYLRLSTAARCHKELSQKIKTLFKDEMYEYKEENGLVRKESVFENVRSGIGIAMVFRNEQALKSFISKNREFLMKNGIKKESIENCLGERVVLDYTDEYIPLYDFEKVFHQSKKRIAKIVREKYLDETYPSYDEQGVLVQKPMFYPLKHGSRGMIFYGIKKEALPFFAQKHQEDLNISDIVLKELSGEIKIFPKTKDHISISDFFKGMGKDTRTAIAKMERFVLQECVQDMYMSQNEAGALISKPIFTYRRHKESGVVRLCIDIKGVSTFLKRRKNEIDKMGINLTAFIQKAKGSQVQMQSIILNRLKELGRA